jgi:hypothetical protein
MKEERAQAAAEKKKEKEKTKNGKPSMFGNKSQNRRNDGRSLSPSGKRNGKGKQPEWFGFGVW